MGDIFQKKIDEVFGGMSNVLSSADDVLLAGFDELDRDHDVKGIKGKGITFI